MFLVPNDAIFIGQPNNYIRNGCQVTYQKKQRNGCQVIHQSAGINMLKHFLF